MCWRATNLRLEDGDLSEATAATMLQESKGLDCRKQSTNYAKVNREDDIIVSYDENVLIVKKMRRQQHLLNKKVRITKVRAFQSCAQS